MSNTLPGAALLSHLNSSLEQDLENLRKICTLLLEVSLRHPQLQMFAFCSVHGFNRTCELCVSFSAYKHMHAHMLAWATPRVVHPIVLSYTNKIQTYRDIFMGSLLYFSSEYFLFIIKKTTNDCVSGNFWSTYVHG